MARLSSRGGGVGASEADIDYVEWVDGTMQAGAGTGAGAPSESSEEDEDGARPSAGTPLRPKAVEGFAAAQTRRQVPLHQEVPLHDSKRGPRATEVAVRSRRRRKPKKEAVPRQTFLTAAEAERSWLSEDEEVALLPKAGGAPASEKLKRALRLLYRTVSCQRDDDKERAGVFQRVYCIVHNLEEHSIQFECTHEGKGVEEDIANMDYSGARVITRRSKHDLPKPEDHVHHALDNSEDEDDLREQSAEDEIDMLAMPISDLCYLLHAMRIQLTLDDTYTNHPKPPAANRANLLDRAVLKEENARLKHTNQQLIGVNQTLSDGLLASHHLAKRVQLLLHKRIERFRKAEEDFRETVEAVRHERDTLEARVQEGVAHAKQQAGRVAKKLEKAREEMATMAEESQAQLAALQAAKQAEEARLNAALLYSRQETQTTAAELARVSPFEQLHAAAAAAVEELTAVRETLEREAEAAAVSLERARASLEAATTKQALLQAQLSELQYQYDTLLARIASMAPCDEATQTPYQPPVSTVRGACEALERRAMQAEEYLTLCAPPHPASAGSPGEYAAEPATAAAAVRGVQEDAALRVVRHALCTPGRVSVEHRSANGDHLRTHLFDMMASAWDTHLTMTGELYEMASGAPPPWGVDPDAAAAADANSEADAAARSSSDAGGKNGDGESIDGEDGEEPTSPAPKRLRYDLLFDPFGDDNTTGGGSGGGGSGVRGSFDAGSARDDGGEAGVGLTDEEDGEEGEEEDLFSLVSEGVAPEVAAQSPPSPPPPPVFVPMSEFRRALLAASLNAAVSFRNAFNGLFTSLAPFLEALVKVDALMGNPVLKKRSVAPSTERDSNYVDVGVQAADIVPGSALQVSQEIQLMHRQVVSQFEAFRVAVQPPAPAPTNVASLQLESVKYVINHRERAGIKKVEKKRDTNRASRRTGGVRVCKKLVFLSLTLSLSFPPQTSAGKLSDVDRGGGGERVCGGWRRRRRRVEEGACVVVCDAAEAGSPAQGWQEGGAGGRRAGEPRKPLRGANRRRGRQRRA